MTGSVVGSPIHMAPELVTGGCFVVVSWGAMVVSWGAMMVYGGFMVSLRWFIILFLSGRVVVSELDFDEWFFWK